MPQREEGANCSQDQGREAQPPALSPGLSPPRRAPTLHGAARAGTLRTQSRGRGGEAPPGCVPQPQLYSTWPSAGRSQP